MPHRLLPPQAQRFLRGRHIGVLTTINADGTPLQTPVWYLCQDHLIYIRTSSNSAKARNIGRDPRVSLCVQDERPPYRGVTVKGTASVQPDQPELSARMSRHYLGAIAGFFYLRLRTRSEIEDDPDAIVGARPARTDGGATRRRRAWVGRLWRALTRSTPPAVWPPGPAP